MTLGNMMIRFNTVLIFILFVVALIVYKVFYISVYSSNQYKAISKQNRTKTIYTSATRGVILDRNNKYIAVNDLGFSISIAPHLQNSKQDIEKLNSLFDMIKSRFADIDINKLKQVYKKNDSIYNHKFIKVINYISYEEFFKHYAIFNSNKYFEIAPANKRRYPYDKVASHIIGYTGKVSQKDIKRDKKNIYFKAIGKNGIERFYDSSLKGEIGTKKFIVNALGKEVKTISDTKPKSKNIQVTIDIELQKYISSLFNTDTNKNDEPSLSAAVVVMDIKTGEILSAGSYPEYNPNIFVNGISHKQWDDMIYNPDKPFTNKVIHGLYPPGSVIKMAHSVGFLNNPATQNHKTRCKGSITVGKRKFRCWKASGHKKVEMRKAIRESCDVFFYEASLKSGINNMAKNLSMFGFGEKTGIDMPREFVGINPNKLWKKKKYKQEWYIGETVNTSIGQGDLLATPLQIARYTASLAYGKLVTPKLNINNKTTTIDINATKQQLKLIQQGMIDVVWHKKGTANKGISTSIKIAGKTGTAQTTSIAQNVISRIREQDLEYYKRSHAWLTTYAPYDNPKYVVTMLLEHGGHGGGACGPYVSKIYEKLKQLNYIK